MIDTYWDKYLKEELSEHETEEFYLLLKDDKDAQNELIELVHDEALFGQTSDNLLMELNPLYTNEIIESPLLLKEKSRSVLFTSLAIAILIIASFTVYYLFHEKSLTKNINHNPPNQITSKPKEEVVNKETISNGVIAPKKLSIEQMQLPVALATVQYPTKKVKNIYTLYSNTLVNYGPIFSNLNLTNAQKTQLKGLFSSEYKQVMGGYMKNIKKIKYTCPLSQIIKKTHANDLNKEMFVWARAHVAMTEVIEKKVLAILDEGQKTKYLSLFKIISKYSDENGHIYLSGTNEKMKANTLLYLKQLQPLLK